ncbi:MAG: hypothetical protein EKK54_08060 [Neisseriaceae bacterium]|nr:MAG: hypothetical protein EKK54_08060 [Neisseriaceae bacterium]
MPIQIKKKSETLRKSIEVTKDSSGAMKLQSSAILAKPRRELYRVDFVSTVTSFSPKTDILRENMEMICWLNSPIKEQADRIGWVENEKDLPVFDNSDLYMPHDLFYNFCDTRFLMAYCPHIRPSAPTNQQSNIGGSYGKGRAA